MAGCGCGGGAAKAKEMARQLAQTFGSEVLADNGQVVLEYIGPGHGTQTYGGKGRTPSAKEYRAGNNAAKRFIVVQPEDVAYLLGLGFFRRQNAPAPFVPPPIVEEEQPAPVATPVAEVKAARSRAHDPIAEKNAKRRAADTGAA